MNRTDELPPEPLSAEPFIEEACRVTKLSDFGPEGWREAFDVLLRSINAEAHLNAEGFEMFHGWVLRRLTNRLRVIDWVKRHPEVSSERVEEPIFVCGMPRTGTTILLNLLSQDPRNRPLMKWESMNAVPPPQAATFHSDPRIGQAVAEVEGVFDRSPEMKAIHYEPGDGPTECIELLTQHFVGQDWSFWVVPSYFAWFDHCDMRSALQYHKLCLKLLQSGAPGRWVLKATTHVLYLETLFETYPDARVVIPHRDPVESVVSMSALSCSCKPELMTSGYDAEACRKFYGQFWVSEFGTMIEKMMDFRDRFPDANIHDVRYVDFIRDPLGSVRDLYAHFGEDLSVEAFSRMERHLAANPKGRFGAHHYTPEDFDLSTPQLTDFFSHYVDRYRLGERA
ncbi:MAG: sulfotransferase [Deltaproteobacteria bacterium]|nr:sulfotransferase [Deltaproteobacteria bacterium]